MQIGICGSHRTGKTTLAEAISNRIGIPFLKTSTSAVFKQHGLDPAQPLDFKTRLWIQQRVIEAAVEVWKQEVFITDRTPLDFMAYTLAECQGDTVVDFQALEDYLNQCFEVTQQYFTNIVLVQPAIPLVYEPGKAALNRAYIEHLNIIITGLCNDERISCPFIIIKRDIISLEARIQRVLRIIKKSQNSC
jgi:hypothetical protein